MLARVFIDHAEVGMAVIRGLPSKQLPWMYTFAGSPQAPPEIAEEHTEITCDLYFKAYIVNDAFVTSNKHLGKFHFRDYLTGQLYHRYTYMSGSLEFSAQGLRGRNCKFVSGEIVSEEITVPLDESIYPIGFPQDIPCKNLIEIQEQGKAIAAMSPSGEITIFKEDFQRAADYLAQCFEPVMPKLEVAPEKEVQPGIFEEKIDGYKEGWDF